MRHTIEIVAVIIVAFAAAGCDQIKARHKEQTDAKPQTSPGVMKDAGGPLLLDDEPLLLLEDAPQASAAPLGGADNSRCYVCHINYVQEDITLIHAKANIGCANCHGDSDAHIADESWASGGNGTPPDRMFTQPQINASCMDCHPKATLGQGKKYCTDCHGNHRLAERRCRWK
jgi:hypothetical protein